MKSKRIKIKISLFTFYLKVCDNSIAEINGLRVGDIITHINGIKFMDLSQLHNALLVNEEIEFCIHREEIFQNDSNNSTFSFDDHIADIISAEAELLKEHNVLGVNFQKMLPMANIFKGSWYNKGRNMW